MSTYIVGGGPFYWDVVQTEDAKREYVVKYKCGTDRTTQLWKDDPSNFANTPGLPAVGISWTTFAAALGTSGGDDWAFRTPYVKATPYDNNDEPPEFYEIELKFSHADYEQQRCQSTTFSDPLLEPPQIRVGWQKYRKLPKEDRDGLPYCSSTGELLAGQQTEIDDNHWTVEFTINQLNVDLSLVDSLADTLNDGPIWGLPPERSKFSQYSGTKLYYGSCTAYVRSTYGFEVRKDWTQYLPDVGSQRLIPGGNVFEEDHWEKFRDGRGNLLGKVLMDDAGNPYLDPATQTPGVVERKPYPVANHVLLGIPTSF